MNKQVSEEHGIYTWVLGAPRRAGCQLQMDSDTISATTFI